MAGNGWRPEQYARFKAERLQPFHDLLRAIPPLAQKPRILDLGCGDGRLTHALHQALGGRSTIGVDSSAEMLGKAQPSGADGIAFFQDAIETCSFPVGSFDLVFSNSALHWVPQHERLLRRLKAWTRRHAVIAFQFPSNVDHQSHRSAEQVAASPAFRGLLGGFIHQQHSLPIRDYAAMLYRLGYTEAQVFSKIYVHPLQHAGEVVDWVEGALLTGYRARLQPHDYERFVTAYRNRFLQSASVLSPYDYTYRRNFLIARVP